MKVNLSRLNKKIYIDLKTVGVQAQCLGFRAYLVGGVVRDLLLNKTSSDWDIVVEGCAIKLAKTLANKNNSRLTVYEQFGTATLEFVNGIVMDFSTARSEHYPQPGSLPIVKSGLLENDLFRRDFTINALAVALNPQTWGRLQDFYGGYDDLKNRKIRVLHKQSFVDDPTRILRAARFAARFGFKVETKTLRLLKAAIIGQAPMTVKAPRYYAEFRKLFFEKNPGVCLRQLANWQGLGFIAPDFQPDWKSLARIAKGVLRLRKDPFFFAKDWSGVYFLAFWAQLDGQRIKQCAKTFHFTRLEILRLSGMVEIPRICNQLIIPRMSPSAVYEVLDPVDLEIIYFIRLTTSVSMIARRIDQFLKKSRLVDLQITGKDLKGLGFKPGRELGAVLHVVLLNKIDGKVETHQDEMVLAKSLHFLSVG
ncbi:MAG: CCA tRNA nucleotidyltransferase [Candidatus Omnitrophica bacterium]|nr:CCA tRNA nucleotidyltransferase [Candidatus Omnitrophota bacterium]